jgi:hypothetical protein
MKTVKLICFLFLLALLSFACEKKNERPSILYISGIITDKETSTSLDSVTIFLNHTKNWPYMTKTLYYNSGDGKFNFQFYPEEGYRYSLRFERNGYCYGGCSNVYINRDKEYQSFNVQLIK